MHTPVMQVLRVVKEPHEMHGVKMEPGDHVMVMIGAADTDPSEFGDDGRGQLDFDREANRHLAFGGGAAPLPRLAPRPLRAADRARGAAPADPRLPRCPTDATLNYSPGIREIEHAAARRSRQEASR